MGKRIRARAREMISSAIKNIDDYVTAHVAAQILSAKLGRAVRADYISKMLKMPKHFIRWTRRHTVILYNKFDIEKCEIGMKRRKAPKVVIA